MLALGVVAGALAVASLPRLVPSVRAQQDVIARPIAGMSAEDMTMLRSLDNSFASLAQYIEPSVVHITSEGSHEADILGRRVGEMKGVGTGVVFRKDGWIITNDHVVAGFDKVTVVLADGREFPGTVRRAADNDLAVVKINANDLVPAQFGDSGRLRVGQFAMAVGSPFNLDETVTVGHVSALNRSNRIPDERAPLQERVYTDLIQTDAPINMGNSGGPLINVDGQVIGINSAIYSGTGGSVGIGFAIPSNQVREIAEMLIEKGSITKGYLGLKPESLKEYQLKERGLSGGALVTEVPNDGPAGLAGIKKDDVVERVGTYSVRNQQDVRNAMLHYAPGTTIPVEVIRGNSHQTFKVKLGDAAIIQQKEIQKMKESQSNNGNGSSAESVPFPDMQDFGNLIPRQQSPNGDVGPLHSGKAKLGVTLDSTTDTMRSQFDIPAGVSGAVVTSVAPGSVAEKLGIQPGYVIQEFAGKAIHSAQDLVQAMQNVNWGDSRQITFGKITSNSKTVRTLTATFK